MSRRVVSLPISEVRTRVVAHLAGKEKLHQVACPPSRYSEGQDASLAFVKDQSSAKLSVRTRAWRYAIWRMEVHLSDSQDKATGQRTTLVTYRDVPAFLQLAALTFVGCLSAHLLVKFLTKLLAAFPVLLSGSVGVFDAAQQRLLVLVPLALVGILAVILTVVLLPKRLARKSHAREQRFWDEITSGGSVASHARIGIVYAHDSFGTMDVSSNLVYMYLLAAVAAVLGIPPFMVVLTITLVLFMISRKMWDHHPLLAMRAWIMVRVVGFVPALAVTLLAAQAGIFTMASLGGWATDHLALQRLGAPLDVQTVAGNRFEVGFGRSPETILKYSVGDRSFSGLPASCARPEQFGSTLGALTAIIDEATPSAPPLAGFATVLGIMLLSLAMFQYPAGIMPEMRRLNEGMTTMLESSWVTGGQPAWLPPDTLSERAKRRFALWVVLGWGLYITTISYLLFMGGVLFYWAMTGNVFGPGAMLLLPHSVVETALENLGLPRMALVAYIGLFVGLPMLVVGARVLAGLGRGLSLLAKAVHTRLASRARLDLPEPLRPYAKCIRVDRRLSGPSCHNASVLGLPLIEVSPDVLSALKGHHTSGLTYDHAVALIAHEVGHLEDDGWTAFLRAAGTCSLVGPNIAGVMLDCREIESRADRRAAELVGREGILSALSGTAGGNSRHPIEPARGLLTRHLRALWRRTIILARSVVGADLGPYFHPLLTMRMRELEHSSGTSGPRRRTHAWHSHICGGALGLAAIAAALVFLSIPIRSPIMSKGTPLGSPTKTLLPDATQRVNAMCTWQGVVYAGSEAGLFVRRGNGSWTNVGAACPAEVRDALSSGVTSLHPSGGSMWVGGRRYVLCRTADEWRLHRLIPTTLPMTEPVPRLNDMMWSTSGLCLAYTGGVGLITTEHKIKWLTRDFSFVRPSTLLWLDGGGRARTIHNRAEHIVLASGQLRKAPKAENPDDLGVLDNHHRLWLPRDPKGTDGMGTWTCTSTGQEIELPTDQGWPGQLLFRADGDMLALLGRTQVLWVCEGATQRLRLPSEPPGPRYDVPPKLYVAPEGTLYVHYGPNSGLIRWTGSEWESVVLVDAQARHSKI